MELKEYWFLIKRNWKVFVLIWVLIIFLAEALFFLKSRQQETILSLTISREKLEKTEDYQYDQYYRLLADEKFLDSVLLWFRDPETVKSVLKEIGITKTDLAWRKLANIFQGKKLSPNYAQIYFVDFSPAQAEKVAQVWQKVLNRKNQELNQKEAIEKNWFLITLGKPITNFYEPQYGLVFLITFLVGFPLAVFGVMMIDYFRKTDENRN